MAIKIENHNSAYDVFKVTCPSCGRALSYERMDVRSHRRWPNGFIYCPGCKAPIGHNEANLFKTGEEIIAKRKAQEEKISQAQIEYFSNSEQIKKDINRYKRNRLSHLVLGVIVLIPGTSMITVSLLSTVLHIDDFSLIFLLSFFGVMLDIVGLFLIAMSAVYNMKIDNIKSHIKKNMQDEKDSN